MKINCIAFAALLVASSASPGAIVIGVHDGDTLTVLEAEKPVRIRLANIDAPESAQAFGKRSKRSLSDLCYGKDAIYTITGKPSYGRPVAIVSCDGINVHHAQVERGLAWVDPKYNRDIALAGILRQAQVAQRGLWADKNPIAPWIFRRERAWTSHRR